MAEDHRDADEPALEPPAAASGRLETVIVPRTSDLGGGFEVRRALPSRRRRMVGPFIFFDQMGPIVLRAGSGLDVRPHPHIGLATVTYLFEGEILHRDSLGTVQPIQPGAVNWMTAGSGITHSERTGPEVRARGGPLFGIQSWVALPQADEETAPAFAHHDRDSLPVIEGEGAHVRLIAARSAARARRCGRSRRCSMPMCGSIPARGSPSARSTKSVRLILSTARSRSQGAKRLLSPASSSFSGPPRRSSSPRPGRRRRA